MPKLLIYLDVNRLYSLAIVQQFILMETQERKRGIMGKKEAGYKMV